MDTHVFRYDVKLSLVMILLSKCRFKCSLSTQDSSVFGYVGIIIMSCVTL